MRPSILVLRRLPVLVTWSWTAIWGGHLAVPQFLDKIRDVKTLVPAHRDPTPPASTLHRAMPVDQIKGGFAFRRARRNGHAAADCQTMAVLRQRMAHVT